MSQEPQGGGQVGGVEYEPGSALDTFLKMGAGMDLISPLGQSGLEILANGHTLMVDLDMNPVNRPADVTWYLNKKGVHTHFPMMVDEYLLFVVDKDKAKFACFLLDKVGIVVDNPPEEAVRQPQRQPGLVPA